MTEKDIFEILVGHDGECKFKEAIENGIKPFVIIEPSCKAKELFVYFTKRKGKVKKLAENEKEYIRFEKNIVKYWNKFVKEHTLLHKVVHITEKRQIWLKQRYIKRHFRENIMLAIDKIANSKFLLGKVEKNFTVEFNFLIKDEENYIKILEGHYEDYEKKGIERFIR